VTTEECAQHFSDFMSYMGIRTLEKPRYIAETVLLLPWKCMVRARVVYMPSPSNVLHGYLGLTAEAAWFRLKTCEALRIAAIED